MTSNPRKLHFGSYHETFLKTSFFSLMNPAVIPEEKRCSNPAKHRPQLSLIGNSYLQPVRDPVQNNALLLNNNLSGPSDWAGLTTNRSNSRFNFERHHVIGRTMASLRCECFITARDKFGHFYSDGRSLRPGSPFGQIEINAKHAAWTKLVLADPFRLAWNYSRGCVRSGSIHFFRVCGCGVQFRIWDKLSEVGMEPNGSMVPFWVFLCVCAQLS